MSLTGRLRRVNGSVKTASQPRSRRRIGIQCRAINISCEKTQVSRNQSRGGRARRLAASSIAVTLVAGALIVTYFRAEVAAYVTRYAGHEDTRITEQESRLANQDSRKSNLVAQRQVEAERASAPAEAQQAAQVQQIAGVSVSEAQQSLKEDRAEGWAQEPTEARRAIEGLDEQAPSGSSAERGIARRRARENGRSRARGHRASRADREHSATSSSDRRGTRAERSTRERACGNTAARSRPRPRSRKRQSMQPRSRSRRRRATIAELRQSLEQEQKKTAALMQEAKAAQAMTTAAEPQRRALEEAQARAAALASELAGTQPRDRDPGRAVAKGSRCGHETEAGGGEPPSRNCDNPWSRSKRRPPP